MFNKLTKKQKSILNCTESRVVVKACPGSGKTFSVTARLARLLSENTYKHKGIAVISFTKIAAEEIKKYLSEDYGIKRLDYPHFIGTIDSFINKYIFFPFAHLLLKCNQRPEIVGTEYNPWYEYDGSLTRIFNKKVVDRDPNYYFDKVSFDSEGLPIPLLPASSYHFSWKKLVNKDGNYNKRITDIINAKFTGFKNGKANQADANYFSLQILKEFPDICNALSNKFSHLIIDEAQDTTEIQMQIIDLLDSTGIENIMLVGDPDQAIFEWNTADAELFIKKYKDTNYLSIELDENRRSSANICSVLNKMVRSNSVSISDVKDDQNIPSVIEYSKGDDIGNIKNDFLDKCNDLNIPQEKSAILFRGKKFGEEHFQIANESSYDHPWKNGHYYVRDIIHGKYLTENGRYKEGLKLIEKGYHKFTTPDLSYVSRTFVKSIISEYGFRVYRKILFNFIDLLPDLENKKLNTWIIEANAVLRNKQYSILSINKSKGSVKPASLFHSTELSKYPFEIGTIHSAKGQTFDAVLLYLIKRAGQSYYTNILKKYKLNKRQKEELRLVYVACSRPKRLLWVAVPNEDKEAWRSYLGLN